MKFLLKLIIFPKTKFGDHVVHNTFPERKIRNVLILIAKTNAQMSVAIFPVSKICKFRLKYFQHSILKVQISVAEIPKFRKFGNFCRKISNIFENVHNVVAAFPKLSEIHKFWVPRNFKKVRKGWIFATMNLICSF